MSDRLARPHFADRSAEHDQARLRERFRVCPGAHCPHTCQTRKQRTALNIGDADVDRETDWPTPNDPKKNRPTGLPPSTTSNSPSTSQPIRAVSPGLRIRAGAIFSNCSLRSSANSTGARAFRIGISPSVCAWSPVKFRGIHTEWPNVNCPWIVGANTAIGGDHAHVRSEILWCQWEQPHQIHRPGFL